MANLLSQFKKDIKMEEMIVPESKNMKEVNRILDNIKEMKRMKRDTYDIWVIPVDGTSFKKTHLTPLLILSKENLSVATPSGTSFMIRVLVKDLSTVLSSDEEETFEKDFQKWLGMGRGKATDLLKESTEEKVLYFAKGLLRLIDEKIDKIEKSNSTVDSYLEDSKEDSKLSLERSNFRLQNMNVELKTFFMTCFNPIRHALEPYSSINPSPSFQRDLVWTEDKKQDFIDSILRELPLGAFYVNTSIHDLELGEGSGNLLWDGKQRVHAIYSFLKDEFKVSINGQQYYYSEISSLFNEKLRATYITVMESDFETMEEIVEAYVIINQKQIRHTDEDLEKAKQALLLKKEKYDIL